MRPVSLYRASDWLNILKPFRYIYFICSFAKKLGGVFAERISLIYLI